MANTDQYEWVDLDPTALGDAVGIAEEVNLRGREIQVEINGLNDDFAAVAEAETITALWTFDRDPSAPFAVTPGSAVVANLDADLLDGNHASAFALTAHTHPTADIVSGTFANARISVGNVTQHQASINHDALLNFVAGEHFLQSAIAITAAQTTSGTFANARISVGSVTQHQGSIDHDLLLNFLASEHFIQSAIVTVGTVTTGVWNASVISTTFTSAKVVAVGTGEGLDSSGGSTPTITLDLAELQLGNTLIATDHLIASNAGVNRRQLISSVPLGIFNNDQGWTTNVGDITAVNITAGTGLSGSVNTASGAHNQTLSVNASQTQITAVGTLATGVWNASVIAAAKIASLDTSKIGSGTFVSARLSGAYTGVTKIGKLTSTLITETGTQFTPTNDLGSLLGTSALQWSTAYLRAVVVFNPTGGDKGVGTINVGVNIFKNGGSPLFDYVFDHAFTGKCNVEKYTGLMSLKDELAHAREHRRLHLVPVGDGVGLFTQTEGVGAQLEEAYLHLFALEDRIKELEARRN